ncbi:hypothetical protein [Lederbergia galactosidilytica]|uniref:Uncharacterized protein n=1 Tax=Lederbergia galactosidilytica TaxID=217031 RepID=A0A177ZK39_9BACI|nr:hypothetical protein [Lederbergia galactosidilytica]OAK67258.1 hypothetical protein ABB05_19025 [Lederbergia galactosidilytica]
MPNKLEKTLVYIASGWQILDGLITIFIYGPYIREKGVATAQLSAVEKEGLDSLSGSISSVASIYGILLILLGFITIYLTKTFLKEGIVPKKVPVWFLICGIISYFTMDILSLILYMGAGIIILAKNRSIKLLNNN